MTRLDLAVAIRLARLRTGRTQEQLGAEVGASKAAVSAWETGRTRPSPEHLAALARVFGESLGRVVTDAAARRER